MAPATARSVPSQAPAQSPRSCRPGPPGRPRHRDEGGSNGDPIQEAKPARSSSNSDVITCCWIFWNCYLTKYWSSDGCKYYILQTKTKL